MRSQQQQLLLFKSAFGTYRISSLLYPAAAALFISNSIFGKAGSIRFYLEIRAASWMEIATGWLHAAAARFNRIRRRRRLSA